MTPAFVQRQANGSNAVASTTVTATASADSVLGDTLVLVVATNGTLIDLVSVADNSTQPGQANSWQYMLPDFAASGGNEGLHVLFCVCTRVVKTGDVYTVTLNNANSRKSVGVWEYSGFIQPIARERSTVAAGTATGVSTGGLTNKTAKGIMITPVSNNSGATAGQTVVTPSNSYTQRLGANNSGGGSVQREATMYDRIVSASASQIFSFTDANTIGWLTRAFLLEEGFGINYKNPRGGYAT